MSAEKQPETTIQPDGAPIAYEQPRVYLTTSQRRALSTDLMNGINASLGDRAGLEQNLRDWTALYEMEVDPSRDNDPWPNASNLFLPVVPSQLDATQAYIAARALVPGLYIVSGNTAQAQETAYMVERYYRNELKKQRGPNTWYEAHMTWLHLALRDGVGIMEAVWRKTKSTRKIAEWTPILQDGVPVMDENMKPKHEKKVTEVEVVEYDDVELSPVLLKDFGLMPSSATSIEDAVGVWRTLWLYESDLNEMMASESGWEMYPEAVERALSYVDDGTTDDVAADRQGAYDRRAGGEIAVGNAQGSHTSEFFGNRGPVKVFRVHSKQFDMDKDGVVEENLYLYHDRTQEMLGWMPYDYLTQERPFFAFAPSPRPERFYGYSMVERLAPLQAETNKIYNDRNNAVDLRMLAPRIRKTGTEMDDQHNTFGPGVEWEGDENAVTFMQMPDIPIASFQQESLLNQRVSELTGQNQPALGAQSSGRRTAKEVGIQAAANGTRNDLIAVRFRIACRALINFVHRLKLQYLSDDIQGSDKQGTFTLPRQVLALDYSIDVTGATDPIDGQTRLNQVLGMYQLFSHDPQIMQDPVKSHNLKKMVLEAMSVVNIDQIIGTDQEAQQQAQALQQAMQQQQAAMAANGGKPPQQPGAQGQQQQGQHPQPPHPPGR